MIQQFEEDGFDSNLSTVANLLNHFTVCTTLMVELTKYLSILELSQQKDDKNAMWPDHEIIFTIFGRLF